jgi:TetR/AcrR family transcriptional regulator
MTAAPTSRTQGERADQTRARILDAAIGQFAENGLAGARTEQIAEAAGVNKALLYYYFKSKEELYRSAIESVADGVRAANLAVLESQASPGERFVALVLQHFDRILTKRNFQSLMQQEMIRLHRGESNALSPIVERVFRPLMERMGEVIAEGIASGELIQTDAMQMHYSAMGANAFYFLSAPMMQVLLGTDPLEHKAMEHRRRASILYLGQAIFVDRAHGAQVAERVLAASPIPEGAEYIGHPMHGLRGKHKFFFKR